MKKIVFIFLIFFGLPSILYANSNPEKCPSVQAIQATPFWIQKEGINSSYFDAIQENNKYDTEWENGVWTFIISFIYTKSPEEAAQIAKNVINTLQYNAGPLKNDKGWFCVYTTKVANIQAQTITYY